MLTTVTPGSHDAGGLSQAAEGRSHDFARIHIDMNEVDQKASVSTRRVAHLLDVHTSSVKRWCDAGEMQHGATPGGHRRISLLVSSLVRIESVLGALEAGGDGSHGVT